MNKHKLIWILWPSFLVASIAEAVFFTFFDPGDLIASGDALDSGRMAVYSLGFFLFWLITGASSALTLMLQRTP